MSEIIIKNPIYLRPDDKLDKVNTLINTEGYCHLPVIENNQLVGVVNKVDLSSRYLIFMENNESCERKVSDIPVCEIMNRAPITIHESASIDEVMEVFITKGVQGLIVVNDQNEVKGLVNSFDLLDYLLAA